MRYWLRFWLFAGAVVAAVAAIAVVFYAFLFPESPYSDLGTTGYAASLGVLIVSISVIVWRASDERGIL